LSRLSRRFGPPASRGGYHSRRTVCRDQNTQTKEPRAGQSGTSKGCPLPYTASSRPPPRPPTCPRPRATGRGYARSSATVAHPAQCHRPIHRCRRGADDGRRRTPVDRPGRQGQRGGLLRRRSASRRGDGCADRRQRRGWASMWASCACTEAPNADDAPPPAVCGATRGGGQAASTPPSVAPHRDGADGLCWGNRLL